MHLEGAHGGDDHHRRGLQAGLPALDVDELLRAEIGAEAGLRDHVVAELEAGAGGDHRVAAMGDVGEGAAMDEGGVALQRLHEVGLQGVLEEHRHGARGLDVLEGHRLAVAGLGDDDAAEARLEVVEVLARGRTPP